VSLGLRRPSARAGRRTELGSEAANLELADPRPTSAHHSPASRPSSSQGTSPPAQTPSRALESLDFAILRALLRDHMLSWSGLDPRSSSEDVARSVGVSPSTVRRRLRKLRETGFLLPPYVTPHPQSLGLIPGGLMLRFADVLLVRHALETLGLIDGVIMASEMPAELYVQFAAGTVAGLERRARLLSQLDGVVDVEALPRYYPPYRHSMCALDWRIVQVLRRSPWARARTIAEELNISTKTAKLHLDSLIENNAVSFFPELGVNRFPGTIMVLFVNVSEPSRSETVVDQVLRRFPEAIRTLGPGSLAPGQPARLVHFLFMGSNYGALQDACLKIRGIPDVAGTRLYSAQRFSRYPEWTDELIQARLDSLKSRAGGRDGAARRLRKLEVDP